MDSDTYKMFLDEGPVYFFGNGAEKCKDVINHPNVSDLSQTLNL